MQHPFGVRRSSPWFRFQVMDWSAGLSRAWSVIRLIMADPPRQAALRGHGFAAPKGLTPRLTMNRTIRNCLRTVLESLEVRDVPALWTVGGLNSLLGSVPLPAPLATASPVKYAAAALVSPTTSNS